jgi:hypothetical protein
MLVPQATIAAMHWEVHKCAPQNELFSIWNNGYELFDEHFHDFPPSTIIILHAMHQVGRHFPAMKLKNTQMYLLQAMQLYSRYSVIGLSSSSVRWLMFNL